MKTLDLDAVQAFALLASLTNFTRVAEAMGTTQSAVSLKLKRLEAFLGRRLVERSPRSVSLTAEGEAFLAHAKALLALNERALSAAPAAVYRLRLGVSEHAAGRELPALLAKLDAADPGLTLEVGVGFSRQLLDEFDDGKYDAVIVRQERSHRGGELLADDQYGWFAAPGFERRAGEDLRVASLAAPCGVRAVSLRALDNARIAWREVFVGGGLTAVLAAVDAGLAVAALARRLSPVGTVDAGERFGLPALPRSKVMLYSRVSDGRGKAALRVISAVFRGAAGA